MRENTFSLREILNWLFIILVITFFFLNRYDISSFHTGILGDGNDSLLNLTLIENNIQNIKKILNGAPLATIYRSNAHYPYVETTLFTEPIYIQTILYSLTKFFTQDHNISYNILFLWAFLFNFFSFHFLCKVMKLNDFYSVFFSLLYSSSHLIALQYVHLQNQFIFGFPLISAFTILAIRNSKKKYFYLIVISINLQFFSCAYYGLYALYFSLFFPAVILVFHSDYQFKNHKNRLFDLIRNPLSHKFLLASIFSVIPIAIVYVPFKYITRNLSFERIVEENAYFSNTFSSILTFPEKIVSYPEFLFIEGVAHNSFLLGYFIYLFVILIVISSKKFFKVKYLFLILAFIFFVFSLGPTIKFFSWEMGGPYKILYKFFPGFNSLRVPNRISIISMFFIFLFLLDFIRKNSESNLLNNKITYLIISLVFYLEYGYLTKIHNFSILPNQKISLNTTSKFILNNKEVNPVVLFLDYKEGNFRYKTGPIPEFISLTDGFKTMNGYSGHTFPFQNYIETSLQDKNVYDELFIFLSNLGLTHIIILNYDKTLNQYLNSNKNKFESFKIIQNSHVEIEWKKVQIAEEVNYVKNNQLDFHIIKSINPKKHNFLTDSQHSTYWEGQKHGLQTKEDFLQITIDDAPKDFGILMNNGPFVNRFAYGLDVFCGDKKVGGYNLPKFSIPTFLNNPYGNQHLSINIKNCAGNLLELRVNKISEYSFWSISQFEIYSDK